MTDPLLTGRLVALAAKMHLDPVSAIALPAVITSASRKADMSESDMVNRCFADDELRAYLADICFRADVPKALAD